MNTILLSIKKTFINSKWTLIHRRKGIIGDVEFHTALKNEGFTGPENLFPSLWNVLEKNDWFIYHIDGCPSEVIIAETIQSEFGYPLSICYKTIEIDTLITAFENSLKKNNFDTNITSEHILQNIFNPLTRRQFIDVFYDVWEKEGGYMYSGDDEEDYEIESSVFVECFTEELKSMI